MSDEGPEMQRWCLEATIMTVPSANVPQDVPSEVADAMHTGIPVLEDAEIKLETCEGGWQGEYVSEKPCLESGKRYYILFGSQFLGEFKVRRVAINLDGLIHSTFDGCSPLNLLLLDQAEVVEAEEEPASE